MPHPFLTRVSQGPLLADGAMGTMLYARGVSFRECFDAVNVDRPELVRDIHEMYLVAGAEVIETNTFGANRFKLGEHGLADKVAEINRAGVEIALQARRHVRQPAFIAGSVGPLGRNLAPLGRLRPEEAREAFAEQIAALVEAGVDVLILETFSNLAELREAVLAAREVAPEVPVVAQMTFGQEGVTTFGHAPRDAARALREAGAHMVGANCGIGPRSALAAAREMLTCTPPVPVSAMPNAGWPEQIGGRLLYPATPEYFADFAREAAEAGVCLIGGCCGTTPDHVRAMRAALDAWRAGERPATAGPLPTGTSVPTAPTLGPTQLARALALGQFVITVEMDPPKSCDLSDVLTAAAMLKEAGATVLNVADSPLARMRMSPWAVAHLIQSRVGVETVLHFPTRGRNLLRIQGDLLAAHALGVRNIFVVMGDPTAIGDYPDATDSYDIVPTGLMRLIKEGLNQGKDYAGNSIGAPTNFLVGCALNLNATNIQREVRLLRKKIASGADFALTMPVYDVRTVRRFLEAYGGPVEIPVLAGILPLYNERHARFLHNEVPGIEIPPHIMERVERAQEKPAEGVRIAQELVAELQGLVQGIYIMPPFHKYELAAHIIRVVAEPTLPPG
ncbi:MAG: bifunctional homocysteine S-methyltransferase/methylenetetrahydrofolate reductase [Ardenticatenia bacterium]|nr:bifunctional homocysteine S-methyltransferase/methylenetetrahydrofolate reductase [Ardenticatenia bacterium]